MPIYVPGKLVLRKGWQPMDADAAAYITAVETADAQALEEGTKIAIDNFVLGCKADGIWTAIKASCILAGARTLTGALVPLVGTAPTNFNFASGDYNRKTGLGDASNTTKYINTNRNASTADQQNNHHVAVFATSLPDESGNIGPLLAARISGSAAGSVQLLNTSSFAPEDPGSSPNKIQFLSAFGSGDAVFQAKEANRLSGLTRSSSSGYTSRANQINQLNTSQVSGALANANYIIFARTVGGTGELFSRSRLAFYSIGESLDLALLDARVTDLINAFAAAIP
jgi:hypothetical protein